MTWDWTQVSRTIGEHSTHEANEPVVEAITLSNLYFYSYAFTNSYDDSKE